MPNYAKAGAAINELTQTLIDRYHPDLKESEVTFLVLFAYGKTDEEGEVISPAISAHGYPAAGKCKITAHKDRVAGVADFQIILDGDRWNDWTERQQESLIDHELMHIEVRRDEEGGVMSDDGGRPKLKYRPHDAEVGIFLAVVERHKEDSLDLLSVIQAQQVIQGVFPEWR